MSSRTRGKRAAVAAVVEQPGAEASTSRSRSRRTVKPEPEPEPEPEVEGQQTLADEDALALGEAEDEDAVGEDEDADGEDVDEDEEQDEEVMVPRRSASRRGRGRGRNRGSVRGRGRGRARGGRTRPEQERDDDAGDEEGEATDDAEDEDDEEVIKPSRRARKSVSYKEIPVEVVEGEEEDDDDGDDVDGADDAEEVPSSQSRKRQPPVRLASNLSASTSTPRRRPRQSVTKDADEDEDKTDTPYKREKIPGGSGRGGFSVKGAAAAAARARWDKVRRERAERGEDDEPRSARRPARRQPAAPVADAIEMDSTVTIKGTEYKVGDDELILPDDDKGETKVDAEGRLLGGREYKLVTFTSAERRNPERLYTLTIDAARGCGYTDSLAFLRRCPQILKLSCTLDERSRLIDMGRITGNLKHRQVTMVSVRNVYKLMGARVVKNGKWVTDDYYEDKVLAECAENGYEPYTEVQDDELAVNANANAGGPSSRPTLGDSSRTAANLAPFYTVGGPTTHFAGNGADPWSEAGHGNRRTKMRGAGISEEDWMLRLAEDCRRMDEQLKGWRAERLADLEGADGTKGWVYATEQLAEHNEDESQENGTDGLLKPVKPSLDRKTSLLSQEVTRGDVSLDEEPEGDEVEQGREDVNADVSMHEVASANEAGKIIVEELGVISDQHNWGLGASWQPGVVRAVYEPHTHMPHVPLHTQPTSSTTVRLAPYPIISSASDSKHLNFVQSTITGPAARGLASVEYVFENSGGDEERKRRLQAVEEAVEWERDMKRRRRGYSEVA
ncbi:hypothetical protein IAR55_001719 [Kwoniella newhampshirensis]|uniref:Chromatin structure-remodeling complex protein RSC7 n=1 Tax=Kwoniella newhampshirensis TaxID=1651941 RepID=A0AAW0Z2Z2_9TREE